MTGILLLLLIAVAIELVAESGAAPRRGGQGR